jgi:hypothetical protein
MPIRFAAATAAVAAASLQLAAETVTFTEDTEVFRNPGLGRAALTKELELRFQLAKHR